MDIKKHIRGLYARANMLSRRFFHCSPEVKMTLFRSYCTNFYCTQLWFNYSKETMRKLCVAYNNTIRKLLGYSRCCSASGMLVETNLASFQCLRRKAVYGFKLNHRIIYYFSICTLLSNILVDRPLLSGIRHCMCFVNDQ